VYSLKKVRIIEGLSDKERENSINEVRILASIRNNCNVIKYYEAFIDQSSDG
jgi:NIMA (never in mitosis gene a)-related kinase